MIGLRMIGPCLSIRPCLNRHPTCVALFTKHAYARFPLGKRFQSNYRPNFDPYRYTSGRWIRSEKKQLERRHLHFDWDGLCRKVLHLSPDSRSIMACEKREIGFTRAFIFSLDNDKRVVARLPFGYGGPRGLTTASEVATIKYLQKKTCLPIPNVIDWDEGAANTIGSEYIILEHAAGVQLHEKWFDMTGSQRIKLIAALYERLQDLMKLEFPAYGNIYFAGGPTGYRSIPLADRKFCVGPHCSVRYWDCLDPQYHRKEPNRGPWCDMEGFCDSLVDSGLSRVPFEDDGRKRPLYHGTIEEHIEVLEHARSVIKAMASDPRIQENATPTLLHSGLRTSNIFVSDEDPTTITGIIDWQAMIEPAFWWANRVVPQFAEIVTEAEDDEKEYKNEVLCNETFEACLKHFLPKVGRPRSMEFNLIRPFGLCHTTWDNGSIFLHHDLIELSKDWQVHLGFTGSSPYQPSQEVKDKHKEPYEFFKDVRSLQDLMTKTVHVTNDGWVPSENYEGAMEMQKKLYFDLVRTIRKGNFGPEEPVRNEEDVRMIWPFDI